MLRASKRMDFINEIVFVTHSTKENTFLYKILMSIDVITTDIEIYYRENNIYSSLEEIDINVSYTNGKVHNSSIGINGEYKHFDYMFSGNDVLDFIKNNLELSN
jgi:hypothetical protein